MLTGSFHRRPSASHSRQAGNIQCMYSRVVKSKVRTDIEQAMSTRYTNAERNNTWEPPFTFKRGDGTEGVAVPPHVSLRGQLQAPYNDNKQFSGIEKDEVIPREWLRKMDEYQHKLTADIQWDTGDFLVIDVSETPSTLRLVYQ